MLSSGEEYARLKVGSLIFEMRRMVTNVWTKNQTAVICTKPKTTGFAVNDCAIRVICVMLNESNPMIASWSDNIMLTTVRGTKSNVRINLFRPVACILTRTFDLRNTKRSNKRYTMSITVVLLSTRNCKLAPLPGYILSIHATNQSTTVRSDKQSQVSI